MICTKKKHALICHMVHVQRSTGKTIGRLQLFNGGVGLTLSCSMSTDMLDNNTHTHTRHYRPTFLPQNVAVCNTAVSLRNPEETVKATLKFAKVNLELLQCSSFPARVRVSLLAKLAFNTAECVVESGLYRSKLDLVALKKTTAQARKWPKV